MLLKANLIFWPKWNKKSLKYFFLPASPRVPDRVRSLCTVVCSDRSRKKCFAFKMVATHFCPLGLLYLKKVGRLAKNEPSLYNKTHFWPLGLLYFVGLLAKNEPPYYMETHFWPQDLLY